MDLVNSHALHVVSTASTHHVFDTQNSTQSHTTLDIFITNVPSLVTSFSQSASPFIAGHDFISMNISLSVPRPPPITFLSRQLTRVNWHILNTNLRQQLQQMDIDHDNISPVDAMESSLTKAITAAFDAIAPVRRITIRSKEKPWVTPDLLVMIKDRERMFKVASNLGTPALVAKFKSLRSQVCNKIDTKRTQYLASRLEQAPSAKAR